MNALPALQADAAAVPAVPVATAPAARRIAAALRGRILYGEYAAGRRIVEREITEEFNVSRASAREALRLLQVEGAVELLPGRGAQVPLYDRHLIKSTIEVVEYMEAAAGTLACRRISDEQIDRIARLTAQMRGELKKRNRLGYYALNKQIHEAIVRAAANPVLLADYVKYNGRLYRARFVPGDNDKNVKSAMGEHLQIVELLRARDGEALGKLLANHLSHAWRRAGIDFY